MEYLEFKNLITKANANRNTTINNSVCNKQIYRWFKKNKFFGICDSLTEKDFGIIIKGLNKIMADRLLEGKDILLPRRMGRIELRRYDKKIKFVDGKIKTNLPVDWSSTLKLWYEDEDARKNRTIVRTDSDVLYKICYNKTFANYENKGFFEFFPARKLKKALKEKIINNEIDAFCYEIS